MKGLIAFSAFILSLELAASIPFEKLLGDHHFKHGFPEYHRFDKHHQNGHYPQHHDRGVADSYAASACASSSANVHHQYPVHRPHPHPIHGHHPLPHYPHHNPGYVVHPHHAQIHHHEFQHQGPEHYTLPHYLGARENVEIGENCNKVYTHSVERVHPSFVDQEYEKRTITEEGCETPVVEITVIEREPVVEEKIELPLTQRIILIETDEGCDRALRYDDEDIIEEEYREQIPEGITIIVNERPDYLHTHQVTEEPVNEKLTVFEHGIRHEKPRYFDQEFQAPLNDGFKVVHSEIYERPATYEGSVEKTYFHPGRIV